MDNGEFEIREERQRYDLSERFLAFAVLIIKITRKMPATLVSDFKRMVYWTLVT